MTHPSPTPDDVAALDPDIGIVVHSHLRWDFVWQRPQQLLSRIGRSNPVLFVEEPVLLDDLDAPRLELSTPQAGVYRAVPTLPRIGHARYDDAVATIRALVTGALNESPLAGRFDRVVQWFYTPMPAPEMLGAFDEEAVIYDCMDELSKFRFAPTDIARRERLLLSRADVVFTGGFRLYESKSRYHDNVHCFGCGVDAAHFARARQDDTPLPSDVIALPRPVMGYFGVVDERLDYELLRTLAAMRPHSTLLMIGPVVKVNADELPQAPNIHWVGQRDYAELPSYVKAFDVCLMPFALNEATEFINPTKTLEYMAAGKPVVSTPVADVVRNFAPIVRVARTAEEFVEEVTDAIERVDLDRMEAGVERAAAASWESIVQQMREIIAEAIGARVEERDVDRVLLDMLPPRSRSSPPVPARATPSGTLAPQRSPDAV